MAKRKRNMRRERDDRRTERDSTRCEDRKEKMDARNDISWYSRYPELLVAGGSFPFPYRPGMDVKLGTLADGKTSREFKIPGVLALSWVPSLGISNDATSPASVAAKEIYAKVRSKYSGALEADAPDFMVYLMALDSVFAYIAWLKRLYRTLNAWTPNNYILPDVVLAAYGLYEADVQQLRSEKTLLWQVINELVLQSRKFTCPALMDVFNRHYWMSDNVYTDANSINAQFYVYNLAGVYKYAALPLANDPNNTGAGLQMISMPAGTSSQPLNAAALLAFGRDLIEALVSWDDAYTINGYLMRAFEGAPSFVVAEIAQDEVLTPVYEEEVLVQIENSLTVPLGYSINPGAQAQKLNVTQNVLTNALVSNPTLQFVASIDELNGQPYSQEGYRVPPLLSIRSDAPTVADSVIASRLQALVVDATLTNTNYVVKVDCGTELPLSWKLYTVPYVRTDSNSGPISVYQTIVTTDTGYQLPIEVAAFMAQFDWHPFIWITSTKGYRGSHFFPVGDTHNITSITKEALQNLHRICLFSEFNSFSIA